MSELKVYSVWDKTTRWFHWINVICFTLLVLIGITILNAGALDIPDAGRVLLKTVHVWVGYVFILNLLWRIIWAFIGNPHARWGAILPGGKGYLASLKSYITGFRSGKRQQFLGHNPAGRIGVTLLLVLMSVQAITGLMLAGTDIFYPPFGGWIAEWIAAPGVDPANVVPYARELYDEAAYQEMRSFRSPFIEVHEINFYLLIIVTLIHIVSVIVTEVKEGGTLISAMFTGKKVLDTKPMDGEQE